MNEKINLLVTGAGALLGQGILRCLQEEREKYFIVTADPDARSAGHWLGDKAVRIPFANDKSYLTALQSIVKTHQIHFLFIGTDVELPVLSENKEIFRKQFGVQVIVSHPHVIEIANNKWLTAQFLRENNFPFPLSAMAKERQEVKKIFKNHAFPLFAKPYDGARSKGIRTINNATELDDVMQHPSNLVIQEFLPGEDGEYTAGCVVLEGKCYAVVVMRRDLRDGNTYRAYSDLSGTYDKFLAQVAEKLGVEGPCNFQFRIRGNQPVIFEINARFSGTTPLRMIFGFNEVKAILDFYVRKTWVAQPNLKDGVVLRTWSDILIEKNQLEELTSKGELVEPSCREFSFLNKHQ